VTLAEQLQDALKLAMRAHDAARRDTLRMALSALYNAEKAARRPLSEDEALAVLVREVKTHRESIEAFAKGGRGDLVAKEEAEIAVLSEFLPAALSDDELDALVRQAIREAGATSPRDLGGVMKLLAPRVRGRADGRLVNERVAKALAALDAVASATGPAQDS
jgi:uncharacterized protein YqeY